MAGQWAAAWTFLYLNGVELNPGYNIDDAETFMNAVATQVDLELGELARKLQAFPSD